MTTEIEKTKKLKEQIKNIGAPDYITQVSFESSGDDIDSYNTRLQSYNDKLVESAITLIE